MPLLIDLDVGVDDAGALILASAHKELVHIVALTTVDGEYRYTSKGSCRSWKKIVKVWMIERFIFFQCFLDASMHLCKRVCLSVRP